MKKTLLSLGTLVSTIAPIASVIACGDGDVPGHEAPYSITIQADKDTPTQANIFVDPKGFISDSYIKEIKSRIAESIVAANKDALKYKTMKIYFGDKTVIVYPATGTTLLINASLTDANKNDLDVIFNLIDTPFDNFMTQLKNNLCYKSFFQKNIWENQHHAIDKVDKDEIKRNLLRLFGYDDSNPDTIDFRYKIISDKFMDFTITRTNVVSNPELHSTGFVTGDSYSYFDFKEGEILSMKFNIGNDFSISPSTGENEFMYRTFKNPTNSIFENFGSGAPQNFITQGYKIVKYLLSQNGYNNSNELIFKNKSGGAFDYNSLRTLSDSASKVFTYGNHGETFGIDYDNSAHTCMHKIMMDTDNKTFKIIFNTHPKNEKQWIFGTDGHLVIEPSHEWTMTLEGTYELNDAGNATDTISALTKSIATDGISTIHLLESSTKIIAKNILNHYKFFIDK